MNLALSWNGWSDDPFLLEAVSDPVVRRAQRAAAAAREILRDKNGLERATVQQLLTRLQTLRTSLLARVMGEAGGVTDFRRFTAAALIADVDDLIAGSTQALGQIAERSIERSADLGEQHADQPIRAAQLTIRPGMPGLDRRVITAAFDNTADLLTPPMQQFRGAIVQGIRRVATAGDNRMTEINRLRDQIAGAGFNGAAFKAERIIRTEVNRVFSMANYERMVGLSKDFPFLRKGWRASRDNRVRQGHREAHQTYARGQGIPIEDRFQIKVYNERPGKAPVLQGTAQLRFPVDPDAQPEGKLAAGATIMCRCGSFVDFDIAEFGKFSQAKISTALQGIQRGPAPPPEPPPAKPKRLPAVRKPRVPKIKPLAPVVPGQTTGTAKPAGIPLTTAAKITPKPAYAKVRAAFDIMDRVHGDGELKDFVVGAPAPGQRGMYGYYQPGGSTSYRSIRAQHLGKAPLSDIAITGKGLAAHPYNTTFHETGHLLDNQAFSKGSWSSKTDVSPEWAAWRQAAQNSATLQRLQRWGRAAVPTSELGLKFGGKPVAPDPVYGQQGDGDTPKGVNPRHINYLISGEEVWARAYAQYIAVRSGDKTALAELRLMQKAATYGPVKADQPYNTNPMGKEPIPNSWDYPVVWQDDEFEPIAEAIDKLLEGKGWRTPGRK